MRRFHLLLFFLLAVLLIQRVDARQPEYYTVVSSADQPAFQKVTPLVQSKLYPVMDTATAAPVPGGAADILIFSTSFPPNIGAEILAVKRQPQCPSPPSLPVVL